MDNSNIKILIPNLDIDVTDKDIMSISEEIIKSGNPETNYYAAINLKVNKIRHLQKVIESKSPYWNFKCVKHCTKNTFLSIEEKKLLIAFHSQVILHSNDKKTIQDLNRFLKYNPVNTKSKLRKRK